MPKRKRPCRICSLRRRERELLGITRAAVNDANWQLSNSVRWFTGNDTTAIARYVAWSPVWHRGFVASVTMSCSDWLAHGAAIVGAQPVERVTLSDIRVSRGAWANAATVRPEHRGNPFWAWSSPITNVLSSNAVPWPIYNHLVSEVDNWNKTYPSEQDALDALSDACIQYARAEATRRKLVPPSVWPEVG